MSDTKKLTVEELYAHMHHQVGTLIMNGNESLEVAAILTSVALSMYKTTLNEQDFNRMVDTISDMRGEILPVVADVAVDDTNTIH